jgi:hypothetical protein
LHQVFTPGMKEIFRLRESDRGRPISDIAATRSKWYLGIFDDLKRLFAVNEGCRT